VPVEVIETLSPLVVHRRELRPDSGGAGTFRGGLGQIMEFGVRTAKPYQFAGLYERIDFPPPLAGGEAGEAGRLRTNNGAPLRAKETTMLPPDTVITIEIPGGAGYGSPLERAPERVLTDVREGYVTVEAARERYGVVVDPTSWVVAEAATHELRARRRLRRQQSI
jgi:N-methylhydantoinase B